VSRVRPREKERKVVWFLALLALVVAVLLARLIELEVAMGPALRQLGATYRLRIMPIPAPRGLMVDRHGRLLVGNEPSFSAYFFDLGKPVPARELRLLAAILGEDRRQVRRVIEDYRGAPYLPVLLKSDLTPAEVSRLGRERPFLPGVFVQAVPVRYYPLGPIGAQVFGYVGLVSPEELRTLHDPRLNENSVVGQAGLEAYYQAELQGTDGGEEVEVDALNRPEKVIGRVPPTPGDTLQLTIDKGLEVAAYKALVDGMAANRKLFGGNTATAGAVVVLDVHTGQVLAMVSVPAYDPNWFAHGITEAELRSLETNPDHPFLNRAIQVAAPPGSTYKMVVAVAGLMSHAITLATRIPGYPHYWYPPYPSNWIPVWTGYVDLPEAIGQSNVIFFYETGRRTGIDTIAHWAHLLGFGAPTGIDLPGEVGGLVPTKKLYEAQNGGAFYPALTYYVAIGQGDDEVTLLQLARYVAAVADDGKVYRPYLVERILSPSGKVLKTFRPDLVRALHVPKAYWQAIHAGMHWATIPGPIPGPGGTAGYQFAGFPMAVAGKTGTAQIAGRQPITYFVSYAPYRHPQIAVAATINSGGEGANVAPVVRAIYDYYFHLHDPNPPFPGFGGGAQPAKAGSRHKTRRKG
jgi:penicillin-binding protein 2